FPWRENLRGEPMRRAESFWMKAKRTFFKRESGRGWPWSWLSLGLGSKRSICDGPPSMKMKMQDLALGAKWGRRGARGLEDGATVLAVRMLSWVRSEPRAARPRPEAVV